MSINHDTPRAEIALVGGLWSFDQFGATGVGGRLTVNRSSWLGTEVSVEGKKPVRHVEIAERQILPVGGNFASIDE
jgi:hypothetical protein